VVTSKYPPLYIAGTGQHSGKTFVSLGLVEALIERGLKAHYMKPVGQRAIQWGEDRVDNDVVLIHEVCHLRTRPGMANPVTLPSGFTTEFLTSGKSSTPLMRRIQQGFEAVSQDADIVVIEGTGHAGVGSVVGLSNAEVARLLGARAVIVTGAGVGRPIDEFALNRALFDARGVCITGVIANKIQSHRLAEIKQLLEKWFAAQSVPLLGALPFEPALTYLTVRQIVGEIGAQVVNGEDVLDRRVRKCIIGAAPAHRLLPFLEEGVLAIVPGDRDDLILAAVSCDELDPEAAGTVAICLTSGILPQQSVMRIIKESRVPVIASERGTYDVASEISSLVAKTMPGDVAKVELAKQLISRYVELDVLLDRLLECRA